MSEPTGQDQAEERGEQIGEGEGLKEREWCQECGRDIEHVDSVDDFFSSVPEYQQRDQDSFGVRLGSAAYCLRCWTFGRKEGPCVNVLQAQWQQLNERSRWYSTYLWAAPFGYFALASLTLSRILAEDIADGVKAAACLLAVWIGIGVMVYLDYVKEGQDRAIRLMMRIELHPRFTRTSALGSADDPGFQGRFLGVFDSHRFVSRWVMIGFLGAVLGFAIRYLVVWWIGVLE